MQRDQDFSGRLIEELMSFVDSAEGQYTIAQARRFLSTEPELDDDDFAADIKYDA